MEQGWGDGPVAKHPLYRFWSKIPNTHRRAGHGSAMMGWRWMIPGICSSVHVLPNWGV